MDAWAIGIIIFSLLGWWLSKKSQVFIFTLGAGVGLLVGAVWAMMIVNSVLR